MSRYIEHYEILSHDVDSNNNAKPSVIVRLLQETANHQMRDRGPTYYELFNQGKSYILVRMKCEIFESLHPYDKVDVATWTGGNKGATFKRSYLMTRDGESVVKGYSEWAVVDIKTGTICRVNEIDSSNYETDEHLEMAIPTKFHIPKELDLEYCGERHIEYTDCDLNLHMNNTLYHDMIWNHIPEAEKKVLTGFTMRFMKEAALGKTLEISRGKSLELIPGQGDETGSEESWFFKTFVDSADDGIQEKYTNIEMLLNCKRID